jgi:integrase
MKGSRRKVRGRGSATVWELRIHAGRSPVTGKPKYISRTVHGTAATADEELGKLVAEIGAIDHTGPAATFGDLLDRWLAKATVLKGLSPTTVREHSRTIKQTIKPTLGDVELRRLDGKVLDDFYAALRTRERPLSASSVRRVHAVISAALGQAVKWGELATNPADRASPPAVRQAPKVAPTPDDVQAMIATAEKDDPDLATLIALAAVTGARRGELLGLRWGDVDLDRATLTIERSVAVVGGQWITKDTKTHAGRSLALDPFGLEVLRRHREVMEDRADDLGIALTPDTPILTYSLEHPISPDTASHYVRAIATAAGVDTHLHQLRHFAASQMIGDGTDVRTVAARLGHADASTTLKVYAHALPERDRDAAGVLGRALTPGRSDRGRGRGRVGRTSPP